MKPASPVKLNHREFRATHICSVCLKRVTKAKFGAVVITSGITKRDMDEERQERGLKALVICFCT